MKIALYRAIITLIKKAHTLKHDSAWIPLYAAKQLAGFAYDAKIIDASEYLKIIEHLQRTRNGGLLHEKNSHQRACH